MIIASANLIETHSSSHRIESGVLVFLLSFHRTNALCVNSVLDGSTLEGCAAHL